MVGTFITRLSQTILLLFIVSVVSFGLLYLAPGGPLSQFSQTPGVTAEDLAKIAHQMGLDRPLPVQYLEWAGRMVSGDWGKSYRDSQPVLNIIASHAGPTFLLMGTSMVLAMLIGSLIGIVAALKPRGIFDTVTTIGVMIALSVPTFWFGLVVIYVFAVELGWLPAGSMMTIGDGGVLDILHHLIAPTMVLTLVTLPHWSRYMRASMLGVLNQDYIRTARAKGFSKSKVVMRHAVKNALLPMISVLGLELPSLLGGALVAETIFTWPGMGRLFLDSLSYRDYPTVMGILSISALMVILGNLIADLLYTVADPRMRQK